MTKEEEQEFREKLAETIFPITMNMTEDQIRQIIKAVGNENPDMTLGFAEMLFQQIMVYKYNK